MIYNILRGEFNSKTPYNKIYSFNFYITFMDYISSVRFTSFILGISQVELRTAFIKIRTLLRELWKRYTR